jgi:hypothetical protein
MQGSNTTETPACLMTWTNTWSILPKPVTGKSHRQGSCSASSVQTVYVVVHRVRAAALQTTAPLLFQVGIETLHWAKKTSKVQSAEFSTRGT